ncbi:MAG: class I SAM-dependent methyltransferase [Mariniphaga sp.]
MVPVILTITFLAGQHEVRAQLLDVPYVPTSETVVEKMLDMAQVGPGDYVIDLGSGDGRIVIAAAKRGAFGHGIDLDPKRVREARENAKKAGVEDRVIFIEGNIFDADFSRASVVTMYLLNSVNIQLRPHLLKNLKPGSRLVSHDFDMGSWNADAFLREETSDIYFWIIPARVEGQWTWETNSQAFSMTVGQEFQEIQLQLKTGDDNLAVTNSLLKGQRISFKAANPAKNEKYVYSGRVEGNRILGTVQIHRGDDATVENWTATRR